MMNINKHDHIIFSPSKVKRKRCTTQVGESYVNFCADGIEIYRDMSENDGEGESYTKSTKVLIELSTVSQLLTCVT